MVKLPKIDSEGLRIAKAEGALRVSSVVRFSKQPVFAECDCCGELTAEGQNLYCSECQEYNAPQP